MEGFGIFALLVMLFFGLMPFIALMCIWSNTGKTADYTGKLWNAYARVHGLDPKTGRCTADTNKPLNG